MKIRYETRSFTAAGLSVVQQADAICTAYARQGLRLTLRQLYYRFIATDAFPDERYFTSGKRTPGNPDGTGTKNCQQNYKWLGDLVADGRVSGLVDWEHIEDRGRESSGGDFGWRDPESAIESIAAQYGITHWDEQAEHVEAWVEKDALIDVVARAAAPLDVSYTACKGSPSHSLVHDAAQPQRGFERRGITTHILYLGDHDPTGLDIPRDIQDRLELFGSTAAVERIALTMEQVRQYNPPPNYAKATDSRFEGYVEQYGTDCWELDALEPQVLTDLVDRKIREHLDEDLRQARLEREEHERIELTAIYDNYATVREHLVREGLL